MKIARHQGPRYRLPWLLVAAVLGLPAGTSAEQTGWLLTLDPEATMIRFTLGATLHDVEGSVALESGELRLDSATGALSGDVVIDARSAETGNEKRDREMHRKVLESERFDQFVFTAARLEGELAAAGGSRVTLHGSLAIHGGVHELELPVEVEMEEDRFSATTRFEVPYVEWGMRNPSKLVLRVKKSVEVVVGVGGSVREVASAASGG